MAAWDDDLLGWLAPFLARLWHKGRPPVCPPLGGGVVGAGRPQGRRADGVAMGARRLRPVASFRFERRLERSAAGRGTCDPGGQADRGRGAALVIDDTALPKKGSHS